MQQDPILLTACAMSCPTRINCHTLLCTKRCCSSAPVGLAIGTAQPFRAAGWVAACCGWLLHTVAERACTGQTHTHGSLQHTVLQTDACGQGTRLVLQLTVQVAGVCDCLLQSSDEATALASHSAIMHVVCCWLQEQYDGTWEHCSTLTIHTRCLWDDDTQLGGTARGCAVATAVAAQSPLRRLQQAQPSLASSLAKNTQPLLL